ncbi:sugar ABC transporter substrate-binding protein [Paenibacillus endoradicis]|uniref:sugar ABC transporter substrate-binding protein n=1 Tax=Paenibacillus endoradicis TaxID=2972487 RepID=UPI002158B11E|nr:sugar-binding protein [Paenibacillus endoradicis]MCR8659945.1 sugar ABC transporter substrate-binding protein [Paenibacillus endoradicis]
MKKNFKAVTLFLVVMMLTSILAACGNSKKIEIGIVLPTKDEERWIQDEERFKAALKDSKYNTEILFSQGSSAKEKENVEALIAKGIEVLIICPFDGDGAASAVKAAKEADITVISYDRLITNTKNVDYYVTFDSVSVGKAQAQYLVDKTTGNGQPLYLYAGAATDNNAFLFFQGAWEVLQPKIADGTFKIANSSEAIALQDVATLDREQMSKIIGQVTTNWEPAEAKNKAQTHLTAAAADAKGDVAILGPNDGTSRAIADVFGADGDITSYVISGQDAEKATIQYIIDGKQSMTVLKDVRVLVKDAMDMAIGILDGTTPATTGTYPNGEIDVKAKQTDVVTVDKDNVKKAIVDSGYYEAKEFTNLK